MVSSWGNRTLCSSGQSRVLELGSSRVGMKPWLLHSLGKAACAPRMRYINV